METNEDPIASLLTPPTRPSIHLPPHTLPIWFVGLFALGYVMKQAAGLFIWILCAMFLFALLDPWFEYLKSKGLSAAMASFLLVSGATILAMLSLYLFIYFSTDVISELEESKKMLIEQYQILQTWFTGIFDGFAGMGIRAQAKDLLTGKIIPKVEVVQNSPLSGAVGTSIVTGVGSIVAIVTYFCLCPILTLFMMNEKEKLARTISQTFVIPEKASQAWFEIVVVIRGFFLGNLVLFLVTIPLFALTFKSFNMSSVLTLCVLASLMNVIPFVGAVLTGVLPALALLSQTENVTASIWLYVICAFIHFVVANFVTPKVLGTRLSLNATVSMISLFVWGLLWGPMGLLLAIPLTASLKALFRTSSRPQLQWLAELFDKAHERKIPTISLRRKKSSPAAKVT